MQTEDLIEAEFKEIEWYEDYPIEQYAPDPTKPFSIQLTLLIGPKGLPGDEMFRVRVANALFLADRVREDGAHVVAATILVERFSVAEVERVVREYCKTCRGPTWHEVALLLMRLGRWEFEGMVTPKRAR